MSASDIVYLNGQFLPRAEAKVSVEDRGFIFGDGIYEATRAIEGKMFESARHMRRMQRGLEALQLRPGLGLADIERLSQELLAKNNLLQGEALVYVQVTRGAAPRAHPFPPANVPSTVYISASAFSPPHDKRKTGVKAITVPDIRWSRCDLKTVNLLPAVLAKEAAVQAGAFEAIFVRDGVITEGAYTNAFAVIDGVVRTYPLCNFILGGVTRDVIVECIRDLGMPYSEEPLLQTDIPRMQEFFISSSGNDVMPVVMIDGRAIGDGAPGATTIRIYERFATKLYGSAEAAARARAA